MIAADDLALLGAGFGAAMAAQPGAGAADVALHALGWAEVLDAAPRQGAAEAFSRLGATGAAAALLDDVVLHALGHAPDVATCVVLPDAHRSTPPGRRGAGGWRVAGLVSGRCRAGPPRPGAGGRRRDHHAGGDRARQPDRRGSGPRSRAAVPARHRSGR
ncbi:MAG: hypothetical protein V9E89_16360 [Ilumatobacteraceae bacterium]